MIRRKEKGVIATTQWQRKHAREIWRCNHPDAPKLPRGVAIYTDGTLVQAPSVEAVIAHEACKLLADADT